MKNNSSIRSMLGLTQSEMAQLLNVSRPLFSLHELGRRNLPLHAQHRMAELLAGIQSVPAAKKQPAKASADIRQHLSSLLHENEFQTSLLLRKIAAAERKVAKEKNLLAFAQAFEGVKKNNKPEKVILPSPKTIAVATNSTSESDLMKLRLKQELLEAEKKFLEAKLQAL